MKEPEFKEGWEPGNFKSKCPNLFAREVLGMTDTYEDVLAGRAKRATALTNQQIKLINSPAYNRRTCVRSGHSMGKSVAITVLAVWWLTKNVDNMVLVSSAKTDQVGKVIFPRIKSNYHIGFGKPTRIGTLFIYPDEANHPNWCAIGISGRNTESFASYHPHGDGKVLLIVDEASAMGTDLEEAAEGLISSDNASMIWMGNPLNTRLKDPFRRAFKNKEFNKIHWKTRSHPNIRFDRPIYPGAISTKWIAEMIEAHGADSDIVRARCYGEFPIKLKSDERNKMFDPQQLAEASGLTIEDLLDSAGAHLGEDQREELFEFKGQGHVIQE